MRRAALALARRTPCRQLHSVPVSGSSSVQITTLPNKLRVATESTPGHFSAVGLYVDAGSRFETPESSGISHFLDRMAFKSTRTRSDAEMSTAIQTLGGQIQCSSSREAMMYQSSHFPRGSSQALSLISDTVLNAALLPEEIEAQRDAARYEIREISAKPEMILPEVLHRVAYGGRGLGNPLLCPEDRIDAINEHIMKEYMKTWFRPDRMVVAGAGMPHEELVELADKYFSSLKSPSMPLQAPVQPQMQSSPRSTIVPSPLPSTPSSSPSLYKSLTRAASYLYPNSLAPDSALLMQPIPDSNVVSDYTGGHLFEHKPNSEFNHLYLAFEGAGIHDDDIYALATMQILLGGGGSFSAGGPGKGMYSRLYTHILNHHPHIDHCESFHHIYTDSSLFGLFATFVPTVSRRQGHSSNQIMHYLANQLGLLLHTDVSASELQKAKNQLKSSLMMALESRAIEVEDLGRQILVHNRKIPVVEMCDRIDLVTTEELRLVAHRVFGVGKKATVVCMGHEDVGDWQTVLKRYGVGEA